MASSSEPLSPTRRDALVRRVLLLTFALNLVVAAAKISYGAWSGALSIRADGLHSLVDSLNNVVALFALAFAARPPDERHPYGHRRLELLAASLVGLSLLFIAYDVLSDAVARFGGEVEIPPRLDGRAYWVLGGTWIVNLGVATWEARMGERLKSQLLKSDAIHTRSDVLVTLGVTAAIFLTQSGYPVADLLAAAAVGGFVGWAGLRVARENLSLLTDKALVDPQAVIDAALGVEGVRRAHRVRSRGAPGSIFVDLHIHLAPELSVVQAHALTHRAMEAIGALEGVVDVTIHTEPEGHDEGR